MIIIIEIGYFFHVENEKLSTKKLCDAMIKTCTTVQTNVDLKDQMEQRQYCA